MNRNLVLFNVLVVVLAVMADQMIKALVVAKMALGEAIELLPFLAIYHARNNGIAFSMFSGMGEVGLAALAGVVLVVVMILWIKTPADRRLTHFGLAIIVGGAIGNLIDRVLLGYVVDYVYFHTPVWAFAIFNLADACITVGAGVILFDEFILQPRRERVRARADRTVD
ncbi:putative lipoprotein signal peptidase [Aurantimonas manganoxydans SI85-9A1]|uniref:Lipoprotein signal peptidase n=1 Tax=Aurantimonas manganoxydans (strain ATCC BAA-1229 / DSM 21871 / SI85-9A1) TaxID=287752 RepID=Q1YFD6_AURMS|nr:signal peptidase II [Aurantimonas manganoxydans]EAS49037.1 putative lipoprotein signal peptidase [Aurantimonas manganoxydans SI85-9A1]